MDATDWKSDAIECKSCGGAHARISSGLRWHRRKDSGYHLGRYCVGCGSWIKWEPQTEVNVRAAGGWPKFLGSKGE